MNKTLYTLNIGAFEPAITALTFPLLRNYARKIGAEFVVITERRFPGWPIPVEKLQIHRLADERCDQWSYFFDADALIHPDFFDPIEHVDKATAMHAALDLSTTRFVPDRYFRRAKSMRSPGNWCAIASDWCRDLWEPPTDITLQECLSRINPTTFEAGRQITREHLVDDFLVARNAAKYGLHVETLMDLCDRLKEPRRYLHHAYAVSGDEKLDQIKRVLKQWEVA